MSISESPQSTMKLQAANATIRLKIMATFTAFVSSLFSKIEHEIR